MRRAANGGVLIEIVGPEGVAKANTLASRLKDTIDDNMVVSRPVVRADLRISGFDESVIKDEVITMVTEFGDCLASDVRVGSFRPMRNGLVMTWVQCPLSAAIRISRKGKVNLGWSVARVDLMKARPVQCFRCWHFGHVRNNCNSPSDRTGHCFKCGGTGHNSNTCSAGSHYVICADLGFSTDHRLATIHLGTREIRSGCVLNKIGRNYIVLKCDSLYFFSIYIAPSESNLEFHNTLDELNTVIRAASGRCIITGDFNAKSTLWGGRGSALERWAAGLDLRLINTGVTSTCVQDNGSSVVDLTWSSADICAKFAD